MLRDRQARGHIVTYMMLVAVSLLLLAFSDSRPIRDLRGGVNFALAPVQEALAGGDPIGRFGVLGVRRDRPAAPREPGAEPRAVTAASRQVLQIPVLIIENQRQAELLKTKSTFGPRHRGGGGDLQRRQRRGAGHHHRRGQRRRRVPERHRRVAGRRAGGTGDGGRPQLRHGAAAQRHPVRWSSAGTSAPAPRAR